MASDQLLAMLKELIAIFSGPLPEDEKVNGWDQELWTRYRQIMSDFLTKLTTGEITPGNAPEFNSFYGLSFDGVLSGQVYDKMGKFTDLFHREFILPTEKKRRSVK